MRDDPLPWGLLLSLIMELQQADLFGINNNYYTISFYVPCKLFSQQQNISYLLSFIRLHVWNFFNSRLQYILVHVVRNCAEMKIYVTNLKGNQR